MMKFALFQYIPSRRVQRYPFEQQDTNRMILAFKDGRNVYTRWAARHFAHALSLMDVSDLTVICVPASTPTAHVRRWKRFSALLCKMTGATDGFDLIEVSGSRIRAHVTGEYELATNIKHYVRIDKERMQGRKLLVIDDIYTTGQSSAAFINALEAAGANVCLAVFLAKTRQQQRMQP